MDTKNRPVDLEDKVDLILDILQGSRFDSDDKGLIGEVRQTKKRLFDLEQWKTKTVAWVVGVAFGGGALVTYAISVLLKKQ